MCRTMKSITEWRVPLCAPIHMRDMIDAWRAKQPDLPGRGEAIRRLVMVALAKDGAESL